MPAGFHVASAWVDIHAEDGGLRGEIRRAIESAVEGQDGKVKLNLDAADLRAKVESAVRSAAAGASGEVRLDLDAASLRGKVEGAVRAATAGTRGQVNLDLDAGSLRAKVQAAMATATRGVRGTVNIDGDTGKLLAQVGAAVGVINGMEARIQTDVDTAGLQGKIRAAVAAAGADTRIRVDTDIDYVGKFAAFRAFVAGFRPTIRVDVDVDSDAWSRGMAALADASDGASRSIMGVGRGLTSLRGLASAGPGVLIPVIAAAGVAAGVLAINIAGIAAALASIALPAGIIGLGAWLQSARVDFAAFGQELKSFGQSVSSSMAPAIQAGMRTILGGLQQLRPQITSMFSNAAQLVQPFSQALMGLASGALPGITAALNNMKSAMPGIVSGFSQIGQGVGNFFRELTANGPAIGQLWSTIGTGINQVMTSLGSALSQITGNQAALQVIGQSFQLLAQTIQLAGTALTAFAPAFNQVLQSMSAGLAAIEPLIDGVGRLTSAFSAITGGGGPMAAWDALTGKTASGSDKMAKAMEEANKKMRESQQIAKDFGGGFETGFDMAAAQAETLSRNMEAVNQAMARVGAVGGSGLGNIAGMLTQASQGAQAFNQSLGQMNQNAQSALQGQISLAQAISQAKSQQSSFAGSLSMSNGQLDLTSTKAQGAAQALNQIAQAGTQAATAFANQGNFSAAAASLEKARAAVVSLGQSFGLPKAQAQELANSLLQIPDKEVQFKLNVGAAMNSLNQVKAAFDKVGAEEKKITVTAMTEPAQAALEALGFKIKDLGNGKVEVTANTDTAKAALDGLKAVLDGLQNKKASVQVEASQVPAVTAALEALGAKVESLPNGDVKVTATDGASIVIDSVKGKMDSIPENKEVGIGVKLDNNPLDDFLAGITKIPDQKNTEINATGNAPDKAAEALSAITGIPPEKATALTATGDAAQKAGEVKLKIDGLPDQKGIVVIVNISGTENIDKLEKLNDVQNKAISVQVAITGTEQISKLEALNKVNNKNIMVNVQIGGNIGQIKELEKLNKVGNKNIAVVVQIGGNIDKIKELEKLNKVSNKNVAVNVQIGGNLDKIKELDGLNKVANKHIAVNVSISGADQISKLKELNNIHSKTITVTVNANSGPITQIKSAIDGVKSKTVTITASANAGQVNTLKNAIAQIKAKSVTITANAPAGQVRALKSAIDSVKSKTVTVTANVNGTGAVNALRSAIAGVNSKTVTVTVVTKKVGSAAGGGLMNEKTMLPGFAAGGRSYTGGGGVHGIGSGTSDSILSWLSNGEFVIRASMVKKYGAPLLAAINHGVFDPYANMFKGGANRKFPGLPGFHTGGHVGSSSSSGTSRFGSSSTQTSTSKAIQTFVTYTIRWGDTLTKIARKFGTTVDALVKANGIRNPDRIYAGNTLRIPVKGTIPKFTPGVIPGTKPGDKNYFPVPNFKKLPLNTTKEGDKHKPVSTSQLEELVAGKNAFISQYMFKGSNDKDFATKILNANDIKTLANTLDTIRYEVQGVFKGHTDDALVKYLQTGSKILGDNLQLKVTLEKQMEEAKKSLEDLKQAFDQLHDSVVQNVMNFANINKSGGKGASAETMLRGLRTDVGRSVEFAQALDALRGRGLDSSVIAQIAAAGPVEGLRTARSLLQADGSQLAEINALQGQLKFAADKAGTTAADAMYGAGKAAAQGLVEGLQGNIDAINAIMKQIADAMALAVRQALGIKSPSKVFHGIGVNTIQGLLQGLNVEGQNVPQVIRNFIEQMITNGQVAVNGASISTGNSGTIGAGGVSVSTGTSGAGITVNGGIHVRIDGGQWDLNKSTDRKAVAKALVDDIFEELRERDRKRK